MRHTDVLLIFVAFRGVFFIEGSVCVCPCVSVCEHGCVSW